MDATCPVKANEMCLGVEQVAYCWTLILVAYEKYNSIAGHPYPDHVNIPLDTNHAVM